MNTLELIPLDLLKYTNDYLQRTDQISLKLSNKYLSENIPITMDIDTELRLYTRTIDQLDYAWKNDQEYIQIKELDNKYSKKYSILKKYAITLNLWYFDFNAEFDVFAGTYIILFLTSVPNYTINLQLIDKFENKINSSYEPKSNKIKVKFDTGGKLKVNCNEIKNLKHRETIQYIMCIEEYYWNKLKGYKIEKNKLKIANWKKKIEYKLSKYGSEFVRINYFI
jgi:hypothetical protein